MKNLRDSVFQVLHDLKLPILFQDKEKKLEFIEVLRTVTEGKIYVENERARVTRTLAAIYEKEDNLEKAAKVLQELQVSF